MLHFKLLKSFAIFIACIDNIVRDHSCHGVRVVMPITWLFELSNLCHNYVHRIIFQGKIGFNCQSALWVRVSVIERKLQVYDTRYNTGYTDKLIISRGIIWWTIMELMQLLHNNWPNLENLQVEFHFAGDLAQIIETIPWARCASGNVFLFNWGMLQWIRIFIKFLKDFSLPVYMDVYDLMTISVCVFDKDGW